MYVLFHRQAPQAADDAPPHSATCDSKADHFVRETEDFDSELLSMFPTEYSGTEASLPLVRDSYDQSAFRPIRIATPAEANILDDPKPVFKPKPVTAGDYTYSSDFTEGEQSVQRLPSKKNIEHNRSCSLHNIVYEPSMLDPSLSRTRSHGGLDSAVDDFDSSDNTRSVHVKEKSSGQHTKLIFVKSSESDHDLESVGTRSSTSFSLDPISGSLLNGKWVTQC